MSQRNAKSGDSENSSKRSEGCCETALSNQVDQVLTKAKETSQKVIDEMVGYTQAHPDRALIYAVTTGYALRVMPVARIIGGVVRLAVQLMKPAIMFYGISRAIRAVKP